MSDLTLLSNERLSLTTKMGLSYNKRKTFPERLRQPTIVTLSIYGCHFIVTKHNQLVKISLFGRVIPLPALSTMDSLA
jgi:hypothetical protein